MKQIFTNVSVLFYRRIARFIPDVSAFCGLIVFAVLAILRYQIVRDEQDIRVYASIADRAMQVMHGTMTNVSSEYPPLATVLFWFTRALLPEVNFAIPWLLLMVVSAACAWLYLRSYSLRDASIFAVVLPLTVFILGQSLVFSRYDFYVAVALLLSWRTFHYKSFAESAGWLCIAVSLKIVPILAVPFFLLALPRRSYALTCIGAIFSCTLAAVLCMGVLGYEGTIANISYMLSYHGYRAVQLESVWSGISMITSIMAGRMPHIGFGNMSLVNYDVPMLAGTAAKALIIIWVIGLIIHARRANKQQYFGPLMMIVLLGALVISPVLSPQYFVWIIPMVLFYVAEQIFEKNLSFSLIVITILTLLLCVLTQWIFPLHYQELIESNLTAIVVLNLRNALMTLLLFAFFLQTGLVRLSRFYLSKSPRRILVWMGIYTAVFSVAISTFIFYRPIFITTNTPPVVLYEAAKTIVHRFPVSLNAIPETDMTVQTILYVTPWSQERFFTIKVDDCLQKISINDYQLPSDIGFCGATVERVFDFGPYLHLGNNFVTITVRNQTGLMGADVVPVITVKLLLLILAMATIFIWYVFSMTKMILALSQTSSAALLLEMLYTLFARWIRLPFVQTASLKFLPNTQSRLSI